MSYQFFTFWDATIATKLQKVPHDHLPLRKATFMNNLVIYRDIELKFGK